MEIEIDTLINEVEKRPAIWDMTTHEYSNRTIKRRSWEELVLVFGGPEDSEEKKKNLGLELQKRWKGIRDAYVKEVKKMKQVKSGSGAVKSSYLYYKRLQFLQPTIKKNSTERNFETANVGGDENLESSTENSIEEDSSRVSNEEGTFKSPLQQRKKIKLHPADEHFANII
ncbi:hypothetical protein QTP88_004997 [Uroleucon formosanum]